MNQGSKPNLGKKSLDELRGLAAKHKLLKYRNLKKENLIELIKNEIKDDLIANYFSDSNIIPNRENRLPLLKYLPIAAIIIAIIGLSQVESVKDRYLDLIYGDNIGQVVISGKPLGQNRYIPEFSFSNYSDRTVKNVLIRFNDNVDEIKLGDVSAQLMTSFTEVGIIEEEPELYNFHINQNGGIYFQQIYLFNQVNEMPAIASKLFKYDLGKNKHRNLRKYNVDNRKGLLKDIDLEWIIK